MCHCTPLLVLIKEGSFRGNVRVSHTWVERTCNNIERDFFLLYLGFDEVYQRVKVGEFIKRVKVRDFNLVFHLGNPFP